VNAARLEGVPARRAHHDHVLSAHASLLPAAACSPVCLHRSGRGVFGLRSASARYYDGPVSTISTARASSIRTARRADLADQWRWYREARESRMARMGAEPLQRPAARARRGPEWRLSYVGHASWLLQTAGLNILIDPVWSERVSPVSFAGPKRVNDPGIAFEHLPPIDIVLVSHCHYDHLDVETLARLTAAHKARVVTPLGNDTIMKDHDPAIRAEAYDWHNRVDWEKTFRSHWCRRGIGRRAGLTDRNKRCGPRS
jgi:hypothetical protein